MPTRFGRISCSQRTAMRASFAVAHQYVDYIPEELAERTLYVSKKYGTAVHKCFCGCGREVVTPLSATAWRVSEYEGGITLEPSIGSWSLPCQSHYWVLRGRVVWAEQWSKERIAAGREREARIREEHYARSQGKSPGQVGARWWEVWKWFW